MVDIKLSAVRKEELQEFKKYAQEAFQKSFEDRFGKTEETVLPENDIDLSLSKEGAAAYWSAAEGQKAAGAVLVTDDRTHCGHLELLFVKCGAQSKGIGKKLWFEIERLYPDTEIWETCTPYFDRRNIHFYVNVCGFHIVEFFCEKHPMQDLPEDFIGDGNQGMFLFRKYIKPCQT